MNFEGAGRAIAPAFGRAAAVLALCFSVHSALGAEPASAPVPVDSPPMLPPMSPEQVKACLPAKQPATRGAEKVTVIVTVSPEGAAGNLRFPPEMAS